MDDGGGMLEGLEISAAQMREVNRLPKSTTLIVTMEPEQLDRLRLELADRYSVGGLFSDQVLEDYLAGQNLILEVQHWGDLIDD